MQNITFIITTEENDFLDYCLTSIKKQTYKDWQIILALDSTQKKDDYEMFTKHYKNISLTQSLGVGVANARNEAITHLDNTDFVVFARSNTAFYPEYLGEMLQTINDNNFAYCGYGKINARVGGFRTITPNIFDPELIYQEPYIPIQSLIKVNDITDFDEKLENACDWDFWLRMVEGNKKGIVCNKVLFDVLDTKEETPIISVLLTRKHKKIKQKEPDETVEGVAFIMQNISSYSGGRVHSWMQALSIADLGIPVTMYTDKLPPFVYDFPMYKQPKIKICDLDTLDVKADLYWSSPYQGHIKALQLSHKYNKWSVQPFFDPPDWQKKYHNGESYEAAIVNPMEYKRQYEMYKHDKIKVLSSTNNGIDGYKEFYGFTDNQFTVLPPAINTRMIDVFDREKIERKNWIVSTNRNVPSKAWDEALGAFIPFMHDYKFVIITNNANTIIEKADKFGVPRSSLIIREGGIPDSEKFLIFLQSKAMLTASHFEGFGMHLTEAMATGLSYASYELPSLTEIYKSYTYPRFRDHIFFAEYGNVYDLRRKLGLALEAGVFPTRPSSQKYSFDIITKEIGNIIKPLL